MINGVDKKIIKEHEVDIIKEHIFKKNKSSYIINCYWRKKAIIRSFGHTFAHTGICGISGKNRMRLSDTGVTLVHSNL